MNLNRVISGLVAMVYICFALIHGGLGLAIRVGMGLLLPIFCIWFSEAMGDYVGPYGSSYITERSPSCIVLVLGWLLLLSPLVLWIVYV